MNGSVYIATNDHLPDLVKIGRSADPQRRMIELSGASGVPGTFKLAHVVRVADMIDVEARIHRRFAARRIQGSEFFRMSVSEAKAGLARVALRSRFLPRVARPTRPGRTPARPVGGLLLSLAACSGAIYATGAGAGLGGFCAAIALFLIFLAFAARYNRSAPRARRRRPTPRIARRWTPREVIALVLGVTLALYIRLNGVA